MILEGLEKCIKDIASASKTSDTSSDDVKAKAKLILTIDPSLYVHIKEAKSTRELWEKLKTMFDYSALQSLISTRLENCDSMGAYVNQIVETGQKLRGTGFKIDDEWIGSLLLAGSSEKFSPMIKTIEHSGIDITTDSIKTKLLNMESDVSISAAGSALVATKFE